MSSSSKSLRFLYVVTKNTSTMDYVLPLFWHLRQQRPDVKISCLYLHTNRHSILKKASFYSQFLASLGVQEYDFSDFANYSLIWNSLPSKWKLKLTSLKKILPHFNPDIIFFANHSQTNFSGRHKIFSYMYREKRPVVLLPHGVHNISIADDFMPFDEQDQLLPSFCDYWLPYAEEKPWLKLLNRPWLYATPERLAECPEDNTPPFDLEQQFPYIGYPGLDSHWMDYVFSDSFKPFAYQPQRAANPRALNLYFFLRPFLAKGARRVAKHDAFQVTYNDILFYIGLVQKAIAQAPVPINLVLKPHPSSNHRELLEALKASGVENFEITSESNYALLPTCDIAIGLYSTSLLLPAMAGIPSLIINSPTQVYVHRWDKMKDLYENLSFYVARPKELPAFLNKACEAVRAAGTARCWSKDVEHLRRSFPDGVCDRACQRLDHLLENHTPKSAPQPLTAVSS